MPQITCPHALDGAAVHELAKDGVTTVAHPAQPRTPARVRVAFGTAVGSEQAQLPDQTTQRRSWATRNCGHQPTCRSFVPSAWAPVPVRGYSRPPRRSG